MKVESMGVGLKYCIPSQEEKKSPAGSAKINVCLYRL